jgi:Protein of unknown function (DUF3908)
LDAFYCNEKGFLAFYPKNLYNDKDTEFFILLENGFVIIKSAKDEKGGCLCERSYAKITSKNMFIPGNKGGSNSYELTINFDNNQSLVFNSLEDSNQDWNTEYYE